MSANQVNSEAPTFVTLSPYLLARLIRSTDSRLVAIESHEDDEQMILVYVFAVAGRVESFSILDLTAPIESIVSLYPEAEGFEAELRQRLGLVFQLPEDAE